MVEWEEGEVTRVGREGPAAQCRGWGTGLAPAATSLRRLNVPNHKAKDRSVSVQERRIRRYVTGNWKGDLWGMEAQFRPFLIWALSGSGRLHDSNAGPRHPLYSSPSPVPASRRYTGWAARLCRRGNSCHPPVLKPQFLSRRARRPVARGHALSAVCRQTVQFVSKALYRKNLQYKLTDGQ